jgi:hypothetical protein
MNYLVHADPQAFIDLLLGEGKVEFIGHLLSERIEGDALIIDILLETLVLKNNAPLLLHFEFETRYNAKMRRRLLRYNDQIAERHEDCDVLSGVFHLGDDKDLDASPWIRGTKLEGWEACFQFHFLVKEMKSLTPEQIRRFKRRALLPLIPFAQGGDEWEVVADMLRDLDALDEHELLKIGFQTAWSNGSEEVRLQLRKEYRMIHEELRGDTLFADFLRDALEEGLQKGLQTGLQEGIERTTWRMRRAAVAIVAGRFPALQQRAQKSIKRVKDPERLERLTPRLSLLAQQEIEQILTALDEDETLDQLEKPLSEIDVFPAQEDTKEDFSAQKTDQASEQLPVNISELSVSLAQEMAKEMFSAQKPDQAAHPDLSDRQAVSEQNSVVQAKDTNAPTKDS